MFCHQTEEMFAKKARTLVGNFYTITSKDVCEEALSANTGSMLLCEDHVINT